MTNTHASNEEARTSHLHSNDAVQAMLPAIKNKLKAELEADLNEKLEIQKTKLKVEFEAQLQHLRLESDQERAKRQRCEAELKETRVQLAEMTQDKDKVMLSNLMSDVPIDAGGIQETQRADRAGPGKLLVFLLRENT
ncbi:hypothetical protein BDN72DRAFT_840759 [Pluteus cervinus]|uniref:Uncharacterized protein n=1 Tax=Pluteus cervinus TaxID=181527 RepID=A0ACD3AVG4_9AGAR|nr:hypothetical protein BDN72DRAFT_840759 [Pluteus cervinus]